MTDLYLKMIALGRGDVPGVNEQLLDWFRSAPQSPVGILFLDFPFMRRKRTDDFGWSDTELEETDELIQLIIEQNSIYKRSGSHEWEVGPLVPASIAWPASASPPISSQICVPLGHAQMLRV
jgi:hypothetical protein